jgi:uncharacterized membrane protein
VDAAFTNPLISVLPRLLIGPATYGVYRLIAPSLKIPSAARETVGIVISSVVGSLVNTVLVLSGLGIFGFFPWPMIGAVAVGNGPAEAVVAALISLAVIVAWKRIPLSGGKANLSKEEEK